MSEKKENPVSLKLQKIYCCAGAQFCSSYLEMGWVEINKLEAERDALQDKLDRIKQVSDFPAKTKEMADYNRLIWKILEGEG